MLDIVHAWQARFVDALGRRLVFASDEYYLLAQRAVPAARRVRRLSAARERHRHGAHVRGRSRGRARGRRRRADRHAFGLLRRGRRRARRGLPRAAHRRSRSSRDAAPRADGAAARSAIVTGELGARGARAARLRAGERAGTDVRLVPVANRFFGGNIGVTGLLAGADVAAELAGAARRRPLPAARRRAVARQVPRRRDRRRAAACGRDRRDRRRRARARDHADAS